MWRWIVLAVCVVTSAEAGEIIAPRVVSCESESLVRVSADVPADSEFALIPFEPPIDYVMVAGTENPTIAFAPLRKPGRVVIALAHGGVITRFEIQFTDGPVDEDPAPKSRDESLMTDGPSISNELRAEDFRILKKADGSRYALHERAGKVFPVKEATDKAPAHFCVRIWEGKPVNRCFEVTDD